MRGPRPCGRSSARGETAEITSLGQLQRQPRAGLASSARSVLAALLWESGDRAPCTEFSLTNLKKESRTQSIRIRDGRRRGVLRRKQRVAGQTPAPYDKAERAEPLSLTCGGPCNILQIHDIIAPFPLWRGFWGGGAPRGGAGGTKKGGTQGGGRPKKMER